MNNSFDGKSFKRIPNKTGEKTPVVGVRKERALYTAVGGETSVNTGNLIPAIQYNPGQNILTVKRSTKGPQISGVDFIEVGPFMVSFSTPLAAGEKVEFTKEVTVVGVLALSNRPEVYTTIATAGQTQFNADFYWAFNQSPTKTRGAVRVEVDGVSKERSVHYQELQNLSAPMTNMINFSTPMAGGERITMIPTNQTIDNVVPLSSTVASDVTSLKTRVTNLENATAPAYVPNLVEAFGSGSDSTTSSTSQVLIPGVSLTITTTGGMIDCGFQYQLKNNGSGFEFPQMFISLTDSSDVEIFATSVHGAGIENDNVFRIFYGLTTFLRPAGTYKIKIRWATALGQPITLNGFWKLWAKEVRG